MKIQPPENIRQYIEDEKSVPLVEIKKTLWYHITRAEKISLGRFLHDLDTIPASEWDALPDSEKWALSCAWNNAERILKNCIIKE